jgi:hypothetical protein
MKEDEVKQKVAAVAWILISHARRGTCVWRLELAFAFADGSTGDCLNIFIRY